MDGKRILFYGDSITDGNRYKRKEDEWDLNHQMGHCYAYILSAGLGARYPDRNYSFINKGVSGNRIADLYARLDSDVISKKPDILSMLVGINDLFGETDEQPGTSPEKYEKVYRLILDETRAAFPGCKMVICEPFILPVGRIKERYSERKAAIVPLQQSAARVAKDYRAVFVPLQQRYLDLCKTQKPEYWIWDGVHPTVCGHQIIADAWLEAVSGADIL